MEEKLFFSRFAIICDGSLFFFFLAQRKPKTETVVVENEGMQEKAY